MKLAASLRFHVLLVLLHYVYYTCWPMSTDFDRCCPNLFELCLRLFAARRCVHTWIFYIFESKSNISKQISRDHWYFCVARMWTEKFVIFIHTRIKLCFSWINVEMFIFLVNSISRNEILKILWNFNSMIEHFIFS